MRSVSRNIESVPQSCEDLSLPSRPKFFQQISSGLSASLTIPPVLWLSLWLGARGIETIRGSQIELPETTPLSASYNKRILKNTTQNICDTLRDPSPHAPALDMSHVNGELSTFKSLIQAYSPALGHWFDEMWKNGKIDIQHQSEMQTPSDHRAQYLQGRLTLYDAFFELSDGEKIVVLMHERVHAGDDMITSFSDRFSPQVIGGYVIGNVSTQLSYGARRLSEWVKGDNPKPVQMPSNFNMMTFTASLQHASYTPSSHKPSAEAVQEDVFQQMLRQMPKYEPTPREKIASWLSGAATTLESATSLDGFAHELTYVRDPSELRALGADRKVAKELSLAKLFGEQGNISDANPTKPPLPGQELFAVSAIGLLGKKIKKQHAKSKERYS